MKEEIMLSDVFEHVYEEIDTLIKEKSASEIAGKNMGRHADSAVKSNRLEKRSD